MTSRRQFARLLAGASAGSLLPAAWAQFRVEISGVGATQIPIAITRFRDEERATQSVSAIVRADLERSGLFKAIDSTGVSYDENARPLFPDWRARGGDALVGGSVTRLADGRYDVRYRLWDVVKGAPTASLSVAVGKDDLRLAAHRIADDIFEKLTGEKGVFSTRIAYVSKAGARHILWVADADGENARVVLAGPEPIISPAWSPDGGELAYVSFETRKPVVYVQDVSSGKRRMVANHKGSNSAPAWSPDGQQLAVTLTRDGLSQIYLINRNGENLRRFTVTGGIDTEAAWAPDGASLYFVSDRGGSPQIYRQPIGGGSAERVTFGGSYNISPAPSPDGRHLAYVSRTGAGAFRVTLMELATGTLTPLTDTVDDESPSFAPNSRQLIYATRANGREVLMTTTLDGQIKARLGVPQADVREPVWGSAGR